MITKPYIFDTHAHYDDEAFEADQKVLLAGFQALGIGEVTNIGASMESSRTTLALAEQYPWMWAAVGVHPDEVGELTETDMDELKKLAESPKVRAIGEIGLDYHEWEPGARTPEIREQQRYWFRRQMALSRELDLPVVIHSREAAAETYDILAEDKEILTSESSSQSDMIGAGVLEYPRGVVHCYAYSLEMALRFIDLGYVIGIGGVLTFKNAKKVKEVVAAIPLEKIVLETDSPYLAPVPHRGTRNNSTYLRYVVAEMAKIRGVSEEEIKAVTLDNAHRLYRIPVSD